MGLFDGMMGNASEMNAKKAEQEVRIYYRMQSM